MEGDQIVGRVLVAAAVFNSEVRSTQRASDLGEHSQFPPLPIRPAVEETPGGGLMERCSVVRHPMSATSGPREPAGVPSSPRNHTSRRVRYLPASQLNHRTLPDEPVEVVNPHWEGGARLLHGPSADAIMPVERKTGRWPPPFL